MNILTCSIEFRPKHGGISTFAYEVVQSLAKHGNEVSVVGPRVDGYEEFDRGCSLDITRTDFEFARMEKNLRELVREFRNIFSSFLLVHRLIRERNIDCILCFHWRIFGPVSFFLSRFMGLKFFIVGHGLELAPYRPRPVRGRPRREAVKNLLANVIMKFETKVRDTTFRGAHNVFANSDFTKRMIEDLGVNRRKITITYCGVKPEEFAPSKGTKGVLAKHGVEGKRVVLSLTRLIPRKGLDYSVRAFPRVLERFDNAVYLIVGEGSYEKQLRRIVDEQNLNDRVIFVGAVPAHDLPYYYNACDVFLLPCRERPGGDVEGFGIVFLEANACAKPVIGGRSGGAIEAVEHQCSGLLVDPESEEEISGAVIRLLTDRKLSKELGSNGRARVMERFTWEAVGSRFDQSMKKVLYATGKDQTASL